MCIIFRTYLCIFTYFIVLINTYYSTLLFAKVTCFPRFCNMSQEDYSWMLLPNTHPAWHVGFEKFIKHTFEGTYEGETAACPCCMCQGMAYMSREEVEEHVFHRGLDNDFIKSKTAVRAAEPMDDDACNISEGGDEGSVSNLLSSLISGTCHREINEDEPNVAAKKIFKLMQEGWKELYPGCKEASQVSFIVRLF